MFSLAPEGSKQHLGDHLPGMPGKGQGLGWGTPEDLCMVLRFKDKPEPKNPGSWGKLGKEDMEESWLGLMKHTQGLERGEGLAQAHTGASDRAQASVCLHPGLPLGAWGPA